MRMLMNNLDPEVAERPADLVVYGGAGKAARNWPCYHAIVRELERLGDDETLLVQSGKPVGVFRTHDEAPRVLIANSNLVGQWSNWDEFRKLETLGLIMYGQMTAGSWIYIGTQGILQGTYETFAAAARKHFGGSLAGKLLVSGGLGGMGGAQPLAATMNGAAFLGVEVDPARIRKRIDTGYCDVMCLELEEALRLLQDAVQHNRPLSVGLVGNCAEVLPELARRGRGARPADRPDQRPRSTERLHSERLRRGAGGGVPEARPAGIRRRRARFDCRARARHARIAARRSGGFRLRQQHPAVRGRPRGGGRIPHPGLRAGVYPAAVLRRPRSLSLGGSFRRGIGHRGHR